MTGPDQIFATKTCTVYMDGSSPLQASTREFHRSEEYTRSDMIPAMITEAVALERERAAKVVESLPTYDSFGNRLERNIADAVRKGAV